MCSRSIGGCLFGLLYQQTRNLDSTPQHPIPQNYPQKGALKQQLIRGWFQEAAIEMALAIYQPYLVWNRII